MDIIINKSACWDVNIGFNSHVTNHNALFDMMWSEVTPQKV